MKKKMMLLLALLLTIFPTLQAKTALMIVAHGSPMESWRKPVLDLEPLVKQQVATGKLKGIDIVKVALMDKSGKTKCNAFAKRNVIILCKTKCIKIETHT